MKSSTGSKQQKFHQSFPREASSYYPIVSVLLFFLIATGTANAEQWYHTHVPRGREVNALKFLSNDKILYAGGNEFNDSLQEIWVSPDRGLEWENVNNILTPPWLKSMAFKDTLTGIATGYTGTIIKTTNGAASWVKIPTPINRQFNKVIYTNPNTLYIAGGSVPRSDTLQTILKSIDGGNTWSVVLDRNGYWLHGIAFADSTHGTAVGEGGTILRTTDGGMHWNSVASPVNRFWKAVTFINDTIGYLVGGRSESGDSLSTILRTNNGGISWSVLRDDAIGILNDITFSPNKTGYIVGDKSVLLKSTDQGLNWTRVMLPDMQSFQSFYCVSFRNDQLGMLGGKYGDLYVYTQSTPAIVYALGARYADSSDLTLTAAIHTHGENARYNFMLSLDSTFINAGYLSFYPSMINSNSLIMVRDNFTNIQLIRDTTYYYCVEVHTLSGKIYSDTLSFSTRTPEFTFQTLPASGITTSDAILNGKIDRYPSDATLSFEYGTSPQLGNEITANPASINDTLLHLVSGAINNLAPNTLYYYRLKGVHNNKPFYGNIELFLSGNPLRTDEATNITDTSATLNGFINKLTVNATIKFEYGTTLAFGNETNATPAIVSDTLPHIVSAALSHLTKGKVYYFRLKAEHGTEVFYGETKLFFSGIPYKLFNTLPATKINDSTDVLNGIVDKFYQLPVTVSFQYDTTLALSNELPAAPNFINDTLLHTVSSSLLQILPDKRYYFRLKGTTPVSTYIGETLTFYSGIVLKAFNILDATAISNNSAVLHGDIQLYSGQVSLSFEYGTTPSFGNSVTPDPSIISDTNYHSFQVSLDGLLTDQLYYYRIKATTPTGSIYSDIRQFYTGSSEIPNWDFQYWKTDTVNIPKYWNFVDGVFERVPGHSGNYALKMTRKTFVVNAVVGDGLFGGAAINVTSRPDSVVFYLNYSVNPGDTALFLLVLLKEGRPLTKVTEPLPFTAITGNSNGSFNRIAYKIEYDSIGIPDTIMAGFTTTNFFSGINTSDNNFLIVDDISLEPGNITFQNSNFESWLTTTIESPESWFNFKYIGIDTIHPDTNHMVSKVYFNAPDDYAVQIRNIFWSQGNMVGAGELALHNGILDNKKGGFPIRGKHLTLNGYYKYFPAKDDSMLIDIHVLKGSVAVGSGSMTQKDTVSIFTPFSIPILYDSSGIIPDSADIIIRSGSRNALFGSTLIVDKLSFDGFVSGIKNNPDVLELDGMKVYPNPARNVLIIETQLGNSNDCSLALLAINGQTIRETKIHAGQRTEQLEVGDISPGIYLLVLRNGERLYNKKIVIQ